MSIPPPLLHAISRRDGGAVTLVLGAGCSFESPTDVPLSGDLSEAVAHLLVSDGILAADACANPRDLTCVADAVFARYTSQQELVRRLPLARMQNATPNEGYLIAAAMMCEGAVSSVVTLNYDLALSHALAQVGAGELVSVVCAPAEFQRLGQRNVVYLHGNVTSDSEQWIMRSAQLNEEWQTGWEAIIAARMLAAPITVFAGLGSDASVLTSTMGKISDVLGAQGIQPYFVDPQELSVDGIAFKLGITPDQHMRMGWSRFMQELADRLLEEHSRTLTTACAHLAETQGLHPEDVGPTIKQSRALGFLGLGAARSRWLLGTTPYAPFSQSNPELVADLLLTVASIQRRLSADVSFDGSGAVQFSVGDRSVVVALASGRGIERWASAEAKIRHAYFARTATHQGLRPRLAIVAGVPGGKPVMAPPIDLTGDGATESIISGASPLELYDVDEIRNDDALANRLIA
ncbi:MAG: hypothetical protein JF886_04125 [Candidatus Dormibacteraeota bacterium]|uniref:SIR2-like domain-containing protein n=1 Tax=Candidatus Aeolococcus gillhamiae TaxID=3127015 RepID=A0A934JVZ0_9BACT|nr:hypothetical protein [Candidatus Dormibacteraeota bacterium]